MSKTLFGAAFGLALALAGCSSIGPNYHAPHTAAPVLSAIDKTQESNAHFQAQWWQQFGDPTLDTLMHKAAAHNLDLQVALARLRASRAQLGLAEAYRWPTVNTGASYSRSREQQPGFSTQRSTVNRYQAGFDATWELDLFGGIRRSVEAANADLGASEAGLQDVQVSLMAEVARNYFNLRGTQLRLKIAQRGVRIQKETLALTQSRERIGTGSDQDVASAGARLAAVEAELPQLQAEAKASEYRLAVLLGERPDQLNVDLSPAHFQPITTTLPIGDAGNILARRPDVRVAERQFAAATARIGIAKADYYPKVALGGFIGFLTGESHDFGRSASEAWSLTPSISWSILDWKRLGARLDTSKANADAALANYKQTVLLAIEDIDNALTGFNQQRARVEKLMDQSRLSRKAADIAKVRYQEGATDFLALLDAQRTALTADDDLAQAETAVNTQAVALYKALGGGWQACGDAECSALAANP
ncbi:efflux transporter outer membrane subunit [Mangrovitalea sediminis]|uniref:efflux transporter outer membrane subunit n=1 Tax=Mangrovitalea sediminis TaxID=1982043 RepID=UPI000BE57E54|nr:efflux transporter outer membrane subunit [Mangrovitalea sediminis]